MLRARKLMFLVLMSILTSPILAQQPRTTAAFNHYVADAEARILRQRSSADTFLTVDSLPPNQRTETLTRLRRGELVIEKRNDSSSEIPGGLVHDWLGTAFIPGATLPQVLAVVRDHDHLTRYYSPDVMQSRIVSRNGQDDLHIFIRFRKHKVVTVVLDTEYDVHYGRVDPAHQYSLSRSTRVTEIADPGTPTEHAVPAGQDHGFMWRLNTYWAFEQANDGVLIECEAISLTRDVPTGLGWLIGPFIHGIPRESLQFTLNATRVAVAAQSKGQHP